MEITDIIKSVTLDEVKDTQEVIRDSYEDHGDSPMIMIAFD